jgi:proton-coupled amino acid transporter
MLALGSFGRWLVDINILISQVGFCCAYLIFISENLHSVFPRVSQLVYLFSILLPLVFLCNLRHLKHLAPFSLFADFATIFAYGIVFYFDMEHFHLLHFHIRNYSLEGLPFYLGVAIYCYEGAGLILSLEGSVSKDLRGSFKTIFLVAMIIVTSLYVGFGVCGYLSFGPDTEDIITLNLPGGLFPFLVKGFLCFSLYFTYPIMMFPVTAVLERMFFSEGTADTNYLLGCVLRTMLVLVSGLIVVAIPNFSTLMALVGSGCCTMLGFILPAVFHWLIFRGDLSLGARLLNMFLIVLGITGSIIGTLDAISRLYGDKTTAQVQPSISPPLSLPTTAATSNLSYL